MHHKTHDRHRHATNSNPHLPYVPAFKEKDHDKDKDTQLHVFADAVCRSRDDGEFGGYGIFAPLYNIRIAEPLPGTVQTVEKAELRALHAALELVHGLRARTAHIHVRSTYVVEAYMERLSKWQQDEWRTANGKPLRNRALWRDVWLLKSVFQDRGVHIDLHMCPRKNDDPMRIAYKLAKYGAILHETCPLCAKTHGRQFVNHGCEPMCNFDNCDGRVLRDVQAYMKHVYRRHRRLCKARGCESFVAFTHEQMESHMRDKHTDKHGNKQFWCEFCGKSFSSRRRAGNHMQWRCKKAPYCRDCGRRFRTRAELEKHNDHINSDDGRDSSDEDIERIGAWKVHRDDAWDGGGHHDHPDHSSSSESSLSDDEDDRGSLFVTDKRGREWVIDEFGYRQPRKRSGSGEGFVPYETRWGP